MIAIVVSRADSASTHIGEHLLELADWEAHEDTSRPEPDGGGRHYRTDGFELREFEPLHLDLEGAAEPFDDPDLLVFASRHSGETGPLLTGHFTGNFGPADYGGEDDRLAETCPNALSRLIAAFEEHATSEYEVGVECTHHGPSEVGVPSMFVELGSDEEQWTDPEAARAVAQSILDLRDVEPHRDRQLVGFGGGHYVPRFERIVRETDWAVGHIAADWGLDAMGPPEEHRETIRGAFETSRADYAVIDGERPDLERVVEDLGYRVVSETWIRETDGVPLSFVDACEERLSSIDDGLRFGERARGFDGEFTVVSLPNDLLAEAGGIDAARLRETAERNLLAFETRENGTVVTGRAAVEDESARDVMIEDLCDVLATKYDEVERTDEAIIVRENAFDPERAAVLGIPEGPLFGRLAAGEPVTVNDESIDPSAVRVERTKLFPL